MTTIIKESASATNAERLPVYTSKEDVKTKFPSIAAAVTATTITDAQVDGLIVMSEEILDGLVGFHKKYHSKFNTDDDEFAIQHTIFPREEDYTILNNAEAPYIPWEIESATQYIVEMLYGSLYDSTAVGSVGGVPADLREMLIYGGSVKIHDFSFSVNAQKDISAEDTSGSTATIKEWVLAQKNGRYTWSLINKFTNFTATFS